jgi:predicted GNAT family N-acyltransferase
MVKDKFTFQLASDESTLADAYQVQQQVFTGEQGIPEELVFDKDDNGALHIIIREGKQVIGTARVTFPRAEQAKLERMAILKPYRGRGLGSRMVSFIVAEMKNGEIKEIVLNAQYEVIPFYETCGFQSIGLPFQEVGKKHIKMELRY